MTSQYVYLVPILLALILAVKLFWLRRNQFKIKTLRGLSKSGYIGKFVYFIEKYIAPSKNSKLYAFYDGILYYLRLTVAEFFAIKIALVVTTFTLLLLIHSTNVSYYTSEVYSKYDYRVDELYHYRSQEVDEGKALEEELHYLKLSIRYISKKESLLLSKEEVQEKILGLIKESEIGYELPPLTMANKVYYRLYGYYSARSVNYPYLTCILIVFFFLPELILKIYNFFIQTDVKKELRFLKRLIILNGSIKPVNFMEVLSILIDKSHYHKKFLKEIEVQNKKNTISNTSIYRKYIEEEKDINVKLFLEKLDQANNYDFDQAITNIENEFNIEKRQRIRNVKRQIELINAWGIVGCFLLIGLLTMYMLIPWLTAYDMNQMF